ncbi:PIR protein [Plasmodium vivax]|uniref:VIR protein n=1 Tax=Plasmodium vivax TaxID=5855 RepID=A0A565A5B3_PLAVI|nr:PIR protein [Plasmodium vivax]
MAKRATDEVFLNYDDYSVIKKVVGPHRDHVFDTKYDVILEDAKVETSKREMYGKSYKEIYRHLHSGGVMYNYMVQGCKYISYLIHKEVKNIPELHYNEETFEIFRKFVEDYHKYQQLHKKPEENTQHRTTELAPLPSQALQDEVENQRGRTSTEATQLTLTSSLPSSPELGTITAESGIQPGVETDLHSGRGPGLVREQIRETEPQGYELHDYRRHGTHVLNETIGKSGYRTAEAPLEQLKLMGERSKYPQDGLEMEQGTMGKITGAITGVLREVEPGPILGVSGGMGALFLLFKYTPVGTFFRGGRVRSRRIPNGFSGPFLGEFPDIQDYYGGNIGYGQMNPLAE